MKEFGSLAALADHLMAETVGGLATVKHGLKLSAELLEKAAKDEVGHYQEAVGPFSAWPELADSTKADRVSKGYTENDPGLRSGEMRDSIEHEAGEWEAVVGSNDEKLVWFELGTEKQPPRPVLGTALYRNLDKVQQLIGNAAVAGFVGGTPINPALGYTIEGSAEK